MGPQPAKKSFTKPGMITSVQRRLLKSSIIQNWKKKTTDINLPEKKGDGCKQAFSQKYIVVKKDKSKVFNKIFVEKMRLPSAAPILNKETEAMLNTIRFWPKQFSNSLGN